MSTPQPHPRQSEINALRVQLMASEAIAKNLGIYRDSVFQALAYYDAAVPVIRPYAAKGMSQAEMATTLGLSNSLVRSLVLKMPAKILAKVRAADLVRRREVDREAGRKYVKGYGKNADLIDDASATRKELAVLISLGVPRYDARAA